MKSSRRKTAIVVSVTVHLLIVAALYAWYVPNRSNKSSTQTAVSGNNDSTSPRDPQPPLPSSPAPDVDDQQIEESVKSQLDAVKKLSEDKKRGELEKNLKRLEAIADEKSVVETSHRVAEAMGLDTKKYTSKTNDNSFDSDPTEAINRFDTKTAQLDDVLRTKSDSGQWRYESVMVDAAGHKIKVPMSQADGESVYQTFQTMKQFPMADGIYRGVVMPLMQKMIEAEQIAQQAEQAARQIEVDHQPSNQSTD